MNLKQFTLFQESIQWAWDYMQARENNEKIDGPAHNQGLWVHGSVDYSAGVVLGEDLTYYPVCGTSCCLAGKATLLNGDRPVVFGEHTGGSANHVLTAEGDLRRVSERAKELFGISEGQAATMFNGDNDAQRLVQEGTRIARYYGHELAVI